MNLEERFRFESELFTMKQLFEIHNPDPTDSEMADFVKKCVRVWRALDKAGGPLSSDELIQLWHQRLDSMNEAQGICS